MAFADVIQIIVISSSIFALLFFVIAMLMNR